MRVSAKVDYGVRAAVLLAGAALAGEGPVKGDRLAAAQDLPVRYLESILGELRAAGILRSQRGAEGGYWLARPPDQVSVADVVRALEGPLATVRGEVAEQLHYPEGTGALQEVWVAVRAALRQVLEGTSLAAVARGELPVVVGELAADPDAWRSGWA